MQTTSMNQAMPHTSDPDTDRDGDLEISWMQLTEQGAALLVEGQTRAALETWQQAYAIATGFAAHDPRLAASLNNIGIGHRVNGDLSQAERHYQLALQAWDGAAAWVETITLYERARSSLFHMRLENRHRDQYRRNAIAAYQTELGAGQAASLNNLAELLHAAERPDDARKLYTESLQRRRTALQKDDPGSRVIARNIASLSDSPPPVDATQPAVCAGSQPFSDQAEQNRWIIDLPPIFTDEGRLMAALLCAFVLDHQAAERLSG
jgi:tetratricopeptide (TPR) repeat protein